MDVFAPLLILAVSLGVFAVWIWSIIDCVTNEPDEGNGKIVWTILIVLLGILGTLLYLGLRRGDRKRELALKQRRGGRVSDLYGS